MERKKHALLDHPILGYFLLILLCYVIVSLCSIIDVGIAKVLPGYGYTKEVMGIKTTVASGVGTAIGSLLALLVFKSWFKGEYKGILKKKGLLIGLLMLAPFLVFHYAGSIVSWITLGTGSVLLAALKALAPGFSEEVMFRGMGVANYMRKIKDEKHIMFIFWLSSIVFGLIHMANFLSGADFMASIVQSIYAIGVGMLFGAVYLRTGNLWPTIIGHWSVDFIEMIRKDLAASNGFMMGMGIGDWITVAAGAFAGVYALVLMSKKHRPEIMEIWKDKWEVQSEVSQ
ncbi:MAG: CPBP family intramembrane metalloprotease [Lachnospiraceae bacterium]|nr:CPBP family intramembrane metalloprotease [Lachnospiraceae bacterium]